LSAAIKNDPETTGVKINDSEYLLSQYPDDSSLILDDNPKSHSTVSKAFSKSINSKRLGISSSSNLSIKSYASLVHSPISLPFKNPFCVSHGFGPSLQKWIKAFYCDISSAVTNNGHVSEFFSLGRGVRQGDPLSPYLFILVLELLCSWQLRLDPSHIA
jgi:hypothetical protein